MRDMVWVGSMAELNGMPMWRASCLSKVSTDNSPSKLRRQNGSSSTRYPYRKIARTR
jgi:hypothetical protein